MKCDAPDAPKRQCPETRTGAVPERFSNRFKPFGERLVPAPCQPRKPLWNRGTRAKVPAEFRRSTSRVLSIIEAAGWPIWFIIVTSVVALAIIGERFWSLRTSLVAPRSVLPATIREYQSKGVSQDLLNRLQSGPLIGRIFAAALVNEKSSREVIKDAVEDAGRAVGL